MFTQVVLYSPDRAVQLGRSVECWNDCEGYKDAQKILCVDGTPNVHPEGWDVIEIPRRDGFFCWADAINTGVNLSVNSTVFYCDSDRVLPTDYFVRVVKIVAEQPRAFVYPKYLYSVQQDANAEVLRAMRDNIDLFQAVLRPDHRQKNPLVLSCKNPMSGCVAFSKDVFQGLGGFDPRFVGWGYPDYDFLMTATRARIPFVETLDKELHQQHPYAIGLRNVELHNLYNLRQYLEKWGLSLNSLQGTSVRLGVTREALLGAKSLKEFMASVSS